MCCWFDSVGLDVVAGFIIIVARATAGRTACVENKYREALRSDSTALLVPYLITEVVSGQAYREHGPTPVDFYLTAVTDYIST